MTCFELHVNTKINKKREKGTEICDFFFCKKISGRYTDNFVDVL